jgi:crossover junction endodeoxyribonuclease RuvC
VQRRILGIDPGTANVGFAVVDQDGSRLTPVWYECLTTSPRERPETRLVQIADAVEQVLRHLAPTELAIEDLYFGASAKAALAVGQARGVCMVTCARAGMRVCEYTPASIKQAVTGYGRADKQQVQAMVQRVLGMTAVPRPDHAADAFAVAITHAFSLELPTVAASAHSVKIP